MANNTCSHKMMANKTSANNTCANNACANNACAKNTCATNKSVAIFLCYSQLGVAVMIHGDDKGMVMPPRVAPIQVVIIPIIYKTADAKELLQRCEAIVEELTKLDMRVKLDDRDNYTPGWKYNDWELKGVCMRIELGPEDMKNQTVRAVRRDTNEKMSFKWSELASKINQTFDSIHDNLFRKAKKVLDASIIKVK